MLVTLKMGVNGEGEFRFKFKSMNVEYFEKETHVEYPELRNYIFFWMFCMEVAIPSMCTDLGRHSTI